MSRNPMLITLAVLLGLATTPAQAGEVPQPTSLDHRVREVNYSDIQVYRIIGVFRSTTQIVFGNGETIRHVALGDSVSWEVAPASNTLFIKPRENVGQTNLIVMTSSPHGPRTYTFELIARPGSLSANDTIFRVLFRYPEQEAAERARLAALMAQQQARDVERQAIRTALDIGVLEGVRNAEYGVQGASSLQPSEISDNGQFTVMRFPAQQSIPAVFSVGDDGQESLVAFDVRDNFLVVHGVFPELRLRRGESLLCIYNLARDRYGRDAPTNTASDLVERTNEEAQ